MNRPSLLLCLAGGVIAAALVFGGPAPRGTAPAATGTGPLVAEPAPGPTAAPARGVAGTGPGSRPSPAPGSEARVELADPDRVGECPPWNGEAATSPTVRRGIDGDGFPTWWHADGSLTKRVVQTGRDASGNPFRTPATVRLTRPEARSDAEPPAAASVQKR
jgi:hypothetical protein